MKKRLMKKLLSLLLVAGLLGTVENASAAIAFVATSTGPNTSATSETLTLPTGYNTAGNVTVAVFTQTCTVSGTIGVITAPSGWTTLLNTPCTLVVYRAYQGGDGATITATSTSTSNWWISVADTYSGVDTTTPVDNFSSFVTIRTDTTNLFRAPQLNPNFNNSMLLVGFTSNQSSGSPSWSGKPAGFTQRGNSDSGPHIWTGEKALTNGTGTGDQTITGETAINFHVGFQLALKQSGAAAATLDPPFPYIAGVSGTVIGVVGATFTPHLDYVNVQNNDIVLVSILGAGVFTTPAGYTKENATQGAVIYSHQWLTGDTLTPTFTYSSGSAYTPYSVHTIRPMSAANVYKDQISGALTSGTTTVTGTTNSLTPAGSNELLLAIFGRNPSSGTDVWSAVSGGLTTDINSSSLLNVAGHVSGAASPTGTFSATDTVTGQTFGIEAVAALYTVTSPVSPSVARHNLLLH
jgi:hypothetical protein